MNKALYTDTQEIVFPTVVYPDSARIIKQFRTNLEQGLRINNIGFLNNVEDQKSNNFSSNFITSPNKLSNLLDIISLKTERANIVTRLEFNRGLTEQTSKFLYIYKDPATTSLFQALPVGLEEITTGAYGNNYFFEVDIINDIFLRVRHNDGSSNYVLNWDETNDILGFVREDDISTPTNNIEQSDMFRYNYDTDAGVIYLFKLNPNDGKYYLLTADGDEITMVKSTGRSLNINILNSIYIEDPFENLIQSQNNDFVSYKAGFTNDLSIDIDKSLFDQNGQYIFHLEYNSQDLASGNLTLNFFTLDVNRSEYNFIKRGTSMVDTLNTIPSFIQRNYTTLDTGNSEEGGHDKMSLVYNFYDKDVFVTNDTTTIFTAPSTLYPFEKININDTSFVKNGAFSGPDPIIADKVFIKQNQPSQYKNGRYLCTWLSAGGANDPGVWVDRYYYPDVVEKFEDLSGEEKYSASFTNSVDTDIANVDFERDNIEGFKYFDKRSDAVITPNCLIRYERIGGSRISSIVEASTPILSGFSNCITSKKLRQISKPGKPYLGSITENYCKDINSDSLTFDGTFYSKLNVYEKINKEKEFTISFDAFIDPSANYGFELLGNNTNTGFGLFQDMTVTPFVHIAGGNTLQIYNTDSVLLNKIVFDTAIKDVFKRSALQNFIVTCQGGDVYRVDPKGNKVKLELVSSINGYINYFMTDDSVYFLMKNNIVKKLELATLNITDESYLEFDEYAGIFGEGEWYENIIRYNNNTYLLPGSDKKIIWENGNTIFYTVKARGVSPGWYVIKHDLNRYPVRFLRSDAPITDMELITGDEYNSLFIAIGNKLFEYNTSGIQVGVQDFDIGNTEEGTELQAGLIGGSIVAIDGINEYITGGVNSKRLAILFASKDGDLTLNGSTETVQQILDITASNYIYTPLTNYNTLTRVYDSKSLDFRLTLRNEFNTEDIRAENISYDINRLDVGVHTFTFSFNSLKGRATLFVDGLLYEDRTFEPGKYNLHNIFTDELYVGSAGFVNGVDLSTYLNQPGYYYVKDLTVSNLFVFDRSVTRELIYALNLLNSEINDLVLSLPHGQRNNKATIERFYKLGRNNSSKKIDVVVNNFNITDESILNQIKLNILEDAANILPVGVGINDIKFT